MGTGTRTMAFLTRSLKDAGSLVSGSDSKQIRSGLVVLEKGKEMGQHETGGGEELIVFLEGTAEVSSGGETRTVHAPSMTLIPAHTKHGVKNESDAPLKYVYVYVMALDAA
jgi:quercetin dioxygenase-like cupin family protein